MGGVGRVGAIDAAQRNDPHRRRRRFHDADLHRAGLAPQEPARPSRRRRSDGGVGRDRNSPAGRGPGCSGGMFRASKLCQWSSTSGPSATVKPSRPMMSFSSSIVCVIGWRWPSRGRTPGIVGSKDVVRRGGLRPPGDALRASSRAASICRLTALNLRAGGRLVGLLDRRRAPFARPSTARSWRRETGSAPPRPPRRRRRRQARPGPLGPGRPVRRETRPVPCLGPFPSLLWGGVGGEG